MSKVRQTQSNLRFPNYVERDETILYTIRGDLSATTVFDTCFISREPILIIFRILRKENTAKLLWIVNSDLSGRWVQIKASIAKRDRKLAFRNHCRYVCHDKKRVIYHQPETQAIQFSLASVTRIDPSRNNPSPKFQTATVQVIFDRFSKGNKPIDAFGVFLRENHQIFQTVPTP